MSNEDAQLEILAVILVDIRATVDSMKRSVTSAQASVEQFRHTQARASLDDIADCLSELRTESATIIDSVAEAEAPLRALLERLA